MMMLYILEGTKAIPVKSQLEWAEWMAKHSNRVLLDEFGGVEISTVFLGIDHGLFGSEPLLFETMVFTDIEGGGTQLRYPSWNEAVEGHKALVAVMRERLAKVRDEGIVAIDSVMNLVQQLKDGE